MRRSVGRLAAAMVGLLLGAGPATGPAGGERTRLTFTETNPLSDLQEWVRREGGTVDVLKKAGAVYEIGQESFEVYVPSECRDGNPHGLLVWISPGKTEWPADWFDVLAKHKLIWVSPNNAGNTRNALVRVSLAMDAAYNLKQRYPVDDARVYVAGFSGGGRAASIAAVGFPDVFTGGLCMMGSNFYRQVPAGEGKAYPVGSFRPPGKLFDEAKKHPIVLMTSDGDMNRDQTKANQAAFTRDGFKHVEYIEVPGSGHTMPAAEWLEKGLDALDHVPVVPSTRPASRPAVRVAATTRPTTVATRSEAGQLLAKGKLYAGNGMTDRAKEYLRRVIDGHPNSTEAGEARQLLDQLDGKR